MNDGGSKRADPRSEIQGAARALFSCWLLPSNHITITITSCTQRHSVSLENRALIRIYPPSLTISWQQCRYLLLSVLSPFSAQRWNLPVSPSEQRAPSKSLCFTQPSHS